MLPITKSNHMHSFANHGLVSAVCQQDLLSVRTLQKCTRSTQKRAADRVERSGGLSDGGKQTCRHRNANTLDHLECTSEQYLGSLISLDKILKSRRGNKCDMKKYIEKSPLRNPPVPLPSRDVLSPQLKSKVGEHSRQRCSMAYQSKCSWRACSNI